MKAHSHIIETYKRLSSEELTELAQNPSNLSDDALPLLAAELKSRNLPAIAAELLNTRKNNTSTTEPAMESVNREVAERMQQGESIESIKADLQERGIDIFHLLNADIEKEDLFFYHLTELKQDGKNNAELQQHIMLEENISEEEAMLVIDRLKKKGKKNMFWGAVWFLVALLLLLYTYAQYDKGLGTLVIPYGALIYGAIRFIKGCIQIRD